MYSNPFKQNSGQYLKSYDNCVEVKPSGIHGKGLFAKAYIPPGVNILIISGEVIDEDECVRREDNFDNVYIFWNGNNYIDTYDTEKIRYINHNCDYNCEVTERDEFSLYLTSAKEIKIGDELTIDYGYDEIYESCLCTLCIKEIKT